ncbi:MAG: DUF2065 domain-containing protein [Alphaproteobacteria bacterium]|jgi:hypothetical protein|nr:DUF2065 domain-containing protein [Alphaproteobacteria bacterium]
MLAIILAAIGLWFLLEGAMYAIAPDAMKRFGAWLSALPEDTVRQSGLWSMAIGAVLLYVMMRFGGA